MICFVGATGKTRYLENIRANLDSDNSGRIRIVTYEDILDQRLLPNAVYVFSHLGIQSTAKRDMAVETWNQLSRKIDPKHLLNHPGRVLRRYELLNRLHELGLNGFRVYRAAEPLPRTVRYPVFIREEKHHTGNLTPLLTSREDVVASLDHLVQASRYPRDELLITEYCHVGDETGLFRRYSAFRIHDQIIAKELSIGSKWLLKRHFDFAVLNRSPGDFRDESNVKEEFRYVDENPHADALMEIFRHANIEYGRIDYGLQDDRIQTWEINTAPSIRFRPEPLDDPDQEHIRQLRLPQYELFYSRFSRAILSLDESMQDKGEIRISFSDEVEKGLRKERRRISGRLFLGTLGRKFPQNPVYRFLRRTLGRLIWNIVYRIRDRQ